MKYVYAAVMVMSLICICLLTILGVNYCDPEIAHGLHPAVASVGALFFVCAGFYASGEIGMA